MTALEKYARLEAEGLWRSAKDTQRRNVIVSIGNASLVITDAQDRPLTHWSLAAITRDNPGKYPAVFRPDGDAEESLELARNDKEMIDAIELLRKAVERRRPKPGRLRLFLFTGIVVALVALSILWLPNAVKTYALHIVPEIKQQDIGAKILVQMSEFSGKPCQSPIAEHAINKLTKRIGDSSIRVHVLRDGLKTTAHLPGGFILIARELIEDHEDPDVVAGFILVEKLRSDQKQALKALLDFAGTLATFKLVTTGELPQSTLKNYAQYVLMSPPRDISDAQVIAGFASVNLQIGAYAYALDMTGEDSLSLIEAAQPTSQISMPILSDNDWIRLQNICGG